MNGATSQALSAACPTPHSINEARDRISHSRARWDEPPPGAGDPAAGTLRRRAPRPRRGRTARPGHLVQCQACQGPAKGGETGERTARQQRRPCVRACVRPRVPNEARGQESSCATSKLTGGERGEPGAKMAAAGQATPRPGLCSAPRSANVAGAAAAAAATPVGLAPGTRHRRAGVRELGSSAGLLRDCPPLGGVNETHKLKIAERRRRDSPFGPARLWNGEVPATVDDFPSSSSRDVRECDDDDVGGGDLAEGDCPDAAAVKAALMIPTEPGGRCFACGDDGAAAANPPSEHGETTPAAGRSAGVPNDADRLLRRTERQGRLAENGARADERVMTRGREQQRPTSPADVLLSDCGCPLPPHPSDGLHEIL
ncbi:unnamed protein product [Lampetra fluviatilis]